MGAVGLARCGRLGRVGAYEHFYSDQYTSVDDTYPYLPNLTV